MGPPARTVSRAPAAKAKPPVASSPRTRRTQAQRREEAEQRILDAAVEIIAVRGLDALTLADAGTGAGFSKGLPVHYFSTKNDLVAAVAKYILRTYVDMREERTAGLQGFERLTAAIGFYFDYPLQNATVVRAYHIVLNSALNKPEIRPLVERIHRSAVQEIQKGLKRSSGVEDAGRTADLQAQSALTYATLLGAVAQWLVNPKAINLPAARDAVIANLRASLEA